MPRIVENTKYISVAKNPYRYEDIWGIRFFMDMSDPIVEKALVQKDYTECHYGGEREWILCQSCGKRCLVLYYLWDRFVCRKCGGLLYEKQTMDPLQRAQERLFVTRGLILKKVKAVRRPYYAGKFTKRVSKMLNRLDAIYSTLEIVKAMTAKYEEQKFNYKFVDPFTDERNNY